MLTCTVYEVSNVLYRKRVFDEDITTLFDTVEKLGIHLYDARELLTPALNAARFYDLQAMYDAFYLGLANLLRSHYVQVEFWTLDKKLKNKVNEDWVKLLSLEG
ncbi:MAG: type II toxin-antitoxin system VapC family toxin [Bacteroidia bacterium]|nr:type II toxin-antitoxin system VapC family toxin [Bacteroidia bacterium]